MLALQRQFAVKVIDSSEVIAMSGEVLSGSLVRGVEGTARIINRRRQRDTSPGYPWRYSSCDTRLMPIGWESCGVLTLEHEIDLKNAITRDYAFRWPGLPA